MKDYTFDKISREKFIKNYNIKDDQIIINLASKEKYVIPYTKENEEKILARMEEQVNSSYIKPLGVIYKSLVAGSYIWILIGIYMYVVSGGILNIALALGTSTLFNIKMFIHQSKVKDLEKQKFFLEYRKMLNDNIKKSSNMTLGVDKKIVKKVEQTEDSPTFDINSIDSYSLNDLKKLRRNILRFQEFGFDEKTNEEKGKRLEYHK